MKFKSKYIFTMQTEQESICKEYVKLAWAYKAFKKYKSFSNVVSLKIAEQTPGYMLNIMFFYDK